jgi:hypothetical protein
VFLAGDPPLNSKGSILRGQEDGVLVASTPLWFSPVLGCMLDLGADEAGGAGDEEGFGHGGQGDAKPNHSASLALK